MAEQEIVRGECDICEADEGCYRESLHSLSPLAVLIDKMEWPHTHGRITLRKGMFDTSPPWIAELENRKSPRVANDASFCFDGSTRSAVLRTALEVAIEEDHTSDQLEGDPLASLLDALPEWSPFDRIVLRRDQLHIYVYVGEHYGGHGLAEALYNMIRLTAPAFSEKSDA